MGKLINNRRAMKLALAGLIVVPLVSLISPKPDREKVDKIFACYDEKVTISRQRSLQE